MSKAPTPQLLLLPQPQPLPVLVLALVVWLWSKNMLHGSYENKGESRFQELIPCSPRCKKSVFHSNSLLPTLAPKSSVPTHHEVRGFVQILLNFFPITRDFITPVFFRELSRIQTLNNNSSLGKRKPL
mmetsp:Transcript_5472/g.6017  ORF Transcript_5472/g.6017 Transcript_5472/m.6017 type:complete len:128 (+) Transcript_5472:203-586(+)